MPTPAGRRPSPEELLHRVQANERRESRGRLKVFLGYAPRIGKSFRMLDEGRRRKAHGQDVLVAATQRDPSPDIANLLGCLDCAPPVDGDGIDIAYILKRNPQVCLIDKLAHDNPPGARNPQRWQDVDELLDSGVSVVTALNIQHICERQDAVEAITGKRAAACVPQQFLKEADEIEIVDAPPEALLDGAALENMPNARQLAELRELALWLAADVVDHQLVDYLDQNGVVMRWGATERILVCLTPRSDAAIMLRSGYRNANRFHGVLLAAYVEQAEIDSTDSARLEANLKLARELGAEVHSLHGHDFVQTILDFGREQRITQLFLGHSGKRGRFRRNPVDRLIDAAEEFDVRIFPHQDVPLPPRESGRDGNLIEDE
jgi:two-component system sensor histidine kinase KdpD